MKGWYRAAVDCVSTPAQVTLNRITAEHVNLQFNIPSPGENITISVEPFEVEESVPAEDEIDWAVSRIRNHHSGGPSRMRA